MMTNLRILDRAKGIAVIGVLMVHVSQINQLFHSSGDHFFGGALASFVDNGARGVQLFFIISGYSLALNYNKYAVASNGVFRFYVARFFRIYPLWIFTLICYLALSDTRGNYLLNTTFLFGFLRWQDPNPEIVVGGWSLFCEVVYYACFPLLFRFMKISVWHSLVAIFTSMVLRISWLEFGAKQGIPDTNSFVGLFPPSNFYAFVLGIAIYTLGPQIEKIRIYKKKLLYLTVGFLIVALCVRDVEQMIISLLMALIIATCQVTPKRTDRYNVLEDIGKKCYSIYLLQFLLIREIEDSFKFETFEPNLLFLPTFTLILLTLLGIGHLVYEVIEKPGVKLGRRINQNLESR